MGFGQAISTCLSSYANFNGRARRSEFWWFWLFVVIVQVVVQTLIAVIVGTDSILYSLLLFVLAIALAQRCACVAAWLRSGFRAQTREARFQLSQVHKVGGDHGVAEA